MLIAVIAIPITLLYLTPAILVWFAPKLDLSQDLYAANRPIAFTFLDANGDEIGHRGALVGDRLLLEDMPAYLPAAFIASLLEPGVTLEESAVAMRWAGMPNKNERALTHDVLEALADAAFLSRAAGGTYRVERSAE